MIQLGQFKRIFPVNRTNIYANWGNSYVFNWPRFETYLPGYDLYRGVAVYDNNIRFYSQSAFLDAIHSLNTANTCIGTFPHLRIEDIS